MDLPTFLQTFQRVPFPLPVPKTPSHREIREIVNLLEQKGAVVSKDGQAVVVAAKWLRALGQNYQLFYSAKHAAFALTRVSTDDIEKALSKL